MSPTKDKVLDALRLVNDPELMLSIVDLGLIYDVIITDAQTNGSKGTEAKDAREPSEKKYNIQVKMTLTSPACPYGPMLIEWTKYATEKVEGVKSCEIKIVWDPPWDPKKMATEEVKLQLGLL
jgi:metal-sulfur cluster biosynthetic enzyme